MPGTPLRLLLGFAAGAVSHIVFQGGLGVLYYAAGLIPGLPWSLAPLPPFGVPTTLNFAFWAGLWGILYALAEPGLTARVGRIGGGLLFGVAAMLVRWFVVLPVKGEPIAEGLIPETMLVFAGFHVAFGLGLALIFAAGLALVRREAPVSPHAIRG